MGKQLIDTINEISARKMQQKEAFVGETAGQLTGTATSMLLATPVVAGAVLALYRKNLTKLKPVDTEIIQKNLLLSEVDTNIARAARKREIARKQREDADADRLTGKTQRELHI